VSAEDSARSPAQIDFGSVLYRDRPFGADSGKSPKGG